MRYGFWLPVFGGWLRNIDDEHMPATWDYVRALTVRAEELGYDLTLIAELNLNDIKVRRSPIRSTPGPQPPRSPPSPRSSS
jgi:FMNH2-dependent dimethyl sulfone monooxygenase